MFAVDVFLKRDVEDEFNPTYLMGCWESNPIQPCFLRRDYDLLYAIYLFFLGYSLFVVLFVFFDDQNGVCS